MKKRVLYKIIPALACLLLQLACEPDEVRTAFSLEQAEGEEAAWAEMPLTIAAAMGEDGPGTKASLLRDVETKGSGALVLVFRSATGQLESYHFFRQDELANQGSVPLSLRVPLAVCDFYILGNLNAIRKSDGAVTNLMDALGASFPVTETSLEAMVYRLDGGDLDGVFRRESFADVAACGIPYALIRKSVNTVSRINAGLGVPDSDRCRRLFSKVTVRIDHSAFDGNGANPEFFVNSRLYLRQANARLQPFSDTPQKAQEAADILAQSDYDPDMQSTNASVTTFSFYVPENMQGTLLPGNTDSREKTRERLLAENMSAVVPYLTYVEFAGRLNPAAGGYGGDVTYRFYIGRDNCSNFDLERGREYNISLTFRVSSIFDPDWKVGIDNWSDERLFRLTADASFTTDIGSVNSSRIVAVRKNRPGAIYVYMNPQGSLGATNLLLGKDVSTTSSFIPSDLSDCAWYGDLMKSGTADADWLAAHGIAASWDKNAGRLQLAVTDAAKFNARIGEAPREFTLTLLPGGTITTRFKIGLYEDLGVTVAGGKSLTEEFYLGQKRTVSVSGFAGTAVKYAAVQEKCGASPSAAKNANVQWKPGLTGAFPSCAVDGAGRVVLDVGNHAYDAQTYTGALDVYAFYPNRFQALHSGWASKNGKIVFFSEDWLNDSMEVELRISEPKLVVPGSSKNYYLPIDGSEVATDYGYFDYAGTTRLDADGFDANLRSSLMQLSFAPLSGDLATTFGDCFSMDFSGRAYVSKTQSGSARMEDLAYASASGRTTGNGKFRLRNPVLTDLYPGAGQFNFYVSRLSIVSFAFYKTGTNNVQQDGGANTVTVDYLFQPDDSNEIFRRFGVKMNYLFTNGNMDAISWSRSGTASTYSCSRSSTVVQPVIDYEVSRYDTGSGGEIHWMYYEDRQTMSVGSEPVPGGLVVPYGEQVVTGTYRNKWDGREFSATLSFELKHQIGYCTFIGAWANRNATVYLVPHKGAKYLEQIGSRVSASQRAWMRKVLGQSEITGTAHPDNTSFGYCMYQKSYGVGDYYVYKTTVPIPASNLDVRYVPNYSSATAWSAAALQSYLSSGLSIYGGTLSVSFPALDHVVTTTGSNRAQMDKRGVFISGGDSF